MNQESTQYINSLLNPSDVEAIFRLRLLVARAAQPDSLVWWDDRSLTPEGGFLLNRLFPRAPYLSAIKIAISAANTRHWAAIPRLPKVIHLFDLGDKVEYALSTYKPEESWLPKKPISSLKDLMDDIGDIIPDGVGIQFTDSRVNETMEVELSINKGIDIRSVVVEASALALAYQEGQPEKPVFPFLRRRY